MDIFPRGVATGKAFYNRQAERKHLKNSIDRALHTVIVAPRRFGKTSLMAEVMRENKYPHVWLDFMTITDLSAAREKFLAKIGEFVVKIAPTEEKLKKAIVKYFHFFNPELSIGLPGLKLTLRSTSSPQDDIVNALLNLDSLAKSVGKQVVFVCDEFQEVVRIDKDLTLQGSIRHAAERASNVSYIFSGSRHLPLLRIFSGKENPLYELCDIMTIDRVSENEYRKYINKQAKTKWGHELSDAVFDRIFKLTDYYPKYVNALCDMVWASGLAPTDELVKTLWDSYMLSRKTVVSAELSGLSLNQIRIIKELTKQPTDLPFGMAFQQAVGISIGGIQSALDGLLEKGLVVKVEGYYKIIDPSIRYYFERY